MTNVTPAGILAFPSLNEPRENLNHQLEWTTGIVFDEQYAKSVLDVIQGVLDEERRRNAGFPKDDSVLSIPLGSNYKKNEAGEKEIVPGEFLIRFKRPFELKQRRTGETRRNSAPVVYDSQGLLVQDPPQIGSGTKAKVIYRAYAYDNVKKGVGLYLLGVQIIDLKNGTEVKLEPVAGGWTPGAKEEDDLAELLANG